MTTLNSSPRLGTLIDVFIGGLDLVAEMFTAPAEPSVGIFDSYVEDMALYYPSETGLHGDAISDEDEALISGKERERIERDFLKGDYDGS